MKNVFKKIVCIFAGAALLACAPAQNVYRTRVAHAEAVENMQQAYNLEELLTPVWEGKTCYQESALPVMRSTSSRVEITLLHPVERVLKVQNATLTKTYEEGKDYVVEEGQLFVLYSGDIPIMRYDEYNPSSSDFPNVNGGYLCFSEGAYFHNRQIVVTYTHKTRYDGYVPENKGALLPTVSEKLAQGDDLDLFVLGDSISVGANSSGFTNVSPYLPIYPQLVAEGLKAEYGLNEVRVYNHSVGGKDSVWGTSIIGEALAEHTNVDLAILAFGMNDGNTSMSTFNRNLSTMIDAVKAAFPNAEILLVATMLPNPDSTYYQNQTNFASGMLTDLEKEGVAVANVTAVHHSLLAYKYYSDMTGNNINHPNDYLARVYAQTLLQTIRTQQSIPEQSGEKNGCGGVVSGAVGAPITLALAGAIMMKRRKETDK